jgi:hypothetical protein
MTEGLPRENEKHIVFALQAWRSVFMEMADQKDLAREEIDKLLDDYNYWHKGWKPFGEPEVTFEEDF